LSEAPRIAPGLPFDFAHLADLIGERCASNHRTIPPTVSSAWFRYPLLAFFATFDRGQIFQARSRVTERFSEPAKAEADAFARVGVEREGPWTISISLACVSMSSRPM
jgi:hypothetical protein